MPTVTVIPRMMLLKAFIRWSPLRVTKEALAMGGTLTKKVPAVVAVVAN
jgi:hypothetical protein